MSVLATMRQRQAPWTRSVLGLFVVMWLNMVLQPCAMAFGGSSSHSRTHCPPMQTEEISVQIVFEVEQLDPETPPCETSAAQCAFVDDFNYDGRVMEAKVKKAPSDVLHGIAATIHVIALEGSLIADSGVGDDRFVSGNPPSLNVLYCVYLI